MTLYDWLGNPITAQQWAVLFEDERHLADEVIDGVRVSTVYMGIDHGLGPPPLIFETMIFGGKHHGEAWRWSNERDAREGHRRIVAELRAPSRSSG